MDRSEPPESESALPIPQEGERKRPGILPGDTWIALDILLLLPLFLVALLAGPADPDATTALDPDNFEGLLVANELLTLLLFVGLPLLWLATTRQGGIRGAWSYLRITPPTKRTWPFHLGIASLAVPVAIAVVIGYSALLGAFQVDQGGDPFFAELAATVSWPSLLLVALVAGVGEEVLFRGILQRYIGFVGQAVLFASLHINQGYAALPIIALLALGFGYAVRRGAPLWAVLLTHTAYDLILLGALKLGAQA